MESQHSTNKMVLPIKNGVYKIESFCNGKEKFNVTFEKFSFAETRYLNRFIDYEYFKKQ